MTEDGRKPTDGTAGGEGGGSSGGGGGGGRLGGGRALNMRRSRGSCSPPDTYSKYLQAHTQQGLLSGDPVGMRPHVAVESLISIFLCTTRGGAYQCDKAGDLELDELREAKEKAEAEAPRP